VHVTASQPTDVRPERRWTINAPSTRWQGIDFAEAWRHRELAYFLAQRTLKLRYRQTFFGVAWALLQPLAALLIFGLIFGRFAGLPSDGIPYAAFMYPAMCMWTYASSSVNAASLELVSHQQLVTKVYFPRVLAPLAAMLPGLVDLGLSLVFAAVIMAVTGVTPGPALVLLPLWLAAGVLAVVGVSLWLAALNVRFRDVRQTLPFLTQIWFFLTPVVYSSSIIDDRLLRAVFALNPLVGVMDGIRWSLLAAPPPPAVDLLSALSAIVLLVTGAFYFRAAERRFADVI
jgi:lipopolysaccharide transport system permease protein